MSRILQTVAQGKRKEKSIQETYSVELVLKGHINRSQTNLDRWCVLLLPAPMVMSVGRYKGFALRGTKLPIFNSIQRNC
jgi:hypothetical protein